MRKQFDNDHFQFGFELALGAAYRQGSDAGEVLATLDRINDGDSDSWVREWTARQKASGFASEAETRATDQRARVSPPSCDLLQHCAVLLLRNDRPLLWTRARAVAPATGVVGASRRSDGGRTSLDPLRADLLARVLLSAPDAEPGEPRPLVVMNNGSDGATSSMWVRGWSRRRRARLPLDDLRRPRATGHTLRARHPLPPRLGGGAHPGPRHDARPPGRGPRSRRGDWGQPSRFLGAACNLFRAPFCRRRRRRRRRRCLGRLDRSICPRTCAQLLRDRRTEMSSIAGRRPSSMRCPRSKQLSNSADVHMVSVPIRSMTCSRR